MAESARFFGGASRLNETLRKISAKLDELGIEYVAIGGIALTIHGYARMTDDIDLLVTRQDLKKLHAAVVGLGYARAFEGSKNLRDTDTAVKIEFVLTGDFPVSGKQQPIAFPFPARTAPVVQDGVRFIGLERLIELKLASGMTGGPDRARDLVDVQQLIGIRALPRSFGAALHEYVRGTYEELWDGLRATEKRFVRIWRNKFLTVGAKSIEEMAHALEVAAAELRTMLADGVTLEEGGAEDDYVHLFTPDPEIARRYDMHEESELFDESDDS
jgi:hypothetical protein